MSIRDDILAGLRAAESGSVGDETPEGLLDRYDALKRTEVLAEAVEVARSKYLTDATGADKDNAYNNGITDAVAAIGAMFVGGAR